DIPEVTLVAITDADKEGFLRSERSLIQTIGRAARNAEGRVILYAERTTDSMKKAMDETMRRRQIQTAYNEEHGITPQTVRKKVSEGLVEIYETHSTRKHKDAAALAENPGEVNKEVEILKEKMKKASKNLEFEEAAKYRDQIKRLQLLQLKLLDGSMEA
ncbi:MAG: UvrB/UvrC motif-containing protein, partial [Bdellovibrionales bacterium]|nr:UvrB/UvrC motif-containing protein [Bdellovibrionales bacterium]NQZ18285.1 UvrB/UvrC motif-containing protein [Bdellovibrionales bacterium]